MVANFLKKYFTCGGKNADEKAQEIIEAKKMYQAVQERLMNHINGPQKSFFLRMHHSYGNIYSQILTDDPQLLTIGRLQKMHQDADQLLSLMKTEIQKTANYDNQMRVLQAKKAIILSRTATSKDIKEHFPKDLFAQFKLKFIPFLYNKELAALKQRITALCQLKEAATHSIDFCQAAYQQVQDGIRVMLAATREQLIALNPNKPALAKVNDNILFAYDTICFAFKVIAEELNPEVARKKVRVDITSQFKAKIAQLLRKYPELKDVKIMYNGRDYSIPSDLDTLYPQAMSSALLMAEHVRALSKLDNTCYSQKPEQEQPLLNS